MLDEVKIEYVQEENDILKELFNNIDNNISTIMNSGAGSGKTYALIQCLKYIVSKYGNSLKSNNQHVICITYTNVAADEIKERLGNTDIICVSTIHERLWDIIRPYKKELLNIHVENLKNNVNEIESDLDKNDKFIVYQNFSEKEKQSFIELMLNDDNKSTFYNSYDLKAYDFKKAMTNINVSSELLKNVSNFKKLVSKIYKLAKYKKCINDVSNNENDKFEVIYDARYNTDRLEYFIISHDTLLNYSKIMIENYDRLKDIIIDTYPYIFVDEYQDTNKKVIEILNSIEKRSKTSSRNHSLFLGYFGDSVQNIYNDGVGDKIIELQDYCKSVSKRFNRRSCAEVISIANAIRKDEIKQVSIYKDCDGGSVEFYHGTRDRVDDFISKCKDEFIEESSDELHCFMLTNELVAYYSGIKNIYDIFKNTHYYKKHYNQISTELLNTEPEKLGVIPSLIYRLVNFFVLIKNDKTSIYEIFDKSMCKDLNIEELNDVLNHIKSIKALNLGELIDQLCCIYSDLQLKKHNVYVVLIEHLFNIDNISSERIKRYFCENLFGNENEYDNQQFMDNINQILNISMDEYLKWYNYINRISSNDIMFHTYHGTKGLEFDNVVIIMGNSFGREKNFFNLFFSNYNNENNLNEEEQKKYILAKNLLYVSMTRAIKNLQILYIDEIGTFEENLKLIFNKVYEF